MMWNLGRCSILAVLLWFSSTCRAGLYHEMVVFGDSLSDTGNLFAASGGVFPPPPYFDGRFSNGPIWLETTAALLELPHPDPSLLGGADNAFAGAYTGGGFSTLSGGPNVGTQVLGYVVDHAFMLDPDNLYVMWQGANDILEVPDPASVDVSVSVANVALDIATLAAFGAKTFLVVNLPPLGSLPRHLGGPRSDVLNEKTAEFNLLLSAQLDFLDLALGIKTFRLDVHRLTTAAMATPEVFGFTNVTDPAILDFEFADPDQYLFWDDVHPTAAAHRIIALKAFSIVSPEPTSVLPCCIGFGAILMFHRTKWASQRLNAAKR